MNKIMIIICIIALIFVTDIESNESAPNFCDQNYIDSVLWDGKNYRIERDEWIAEYDENENKVKEFQPKETYNKTLINTKFKTNDNESEFEVNPSEFLSIKHIFTIDLHNRTETKLVDSNYSDSTQYFQSKNVSNYQQFNQSFFKMFAFWPKRNSLLSIHKDNETSDAILLYMKLSDTESHEHYTVRIKESKDIIYRSVFWWKKTDNIYMIAERNHERRNGFVYKFNPEDLKNPFIPTGLKVVEFFGCNCEESKSIFLYSYILMGVCIVIFSAILLKVCNCVGKCVGKFKKSEPKNNFTAF